MYGLCSKKSYIIYVKYKLKIGKGNNETRHFLLVDSLEDSIKYILYIY